MSQTPEVFELSFAVEPGDIDELGHVNNVTYVRWVQDAAVSHWTAAAPPEEVDRVRWVVLRHEIDYKRSALLGDGIIARTWVGTAKGLRFDRHTEIVRAGDGAVLAICRTVWCPIHPQTGRPIQVSDEVRRHFSVAAR